MFFHIFAVMEELNKINPLQFQPGDLFFYEIRTGIKIIVRYSHLDKEKKVCKMVFKNLEYGSKLGGKYIRLKQMSWRLHNKFTLYKT